MGNPATKVATFNGSPDGFTVTGPERYSSGLWLEQGAVNKVSNPIFATDTTGWGIGGANRTGGQTGSLPAPLPGELAALVTTGVHVAATGQMTGTFPGVCSPSSDLTLTADPYMSSVYIYIPSGWSSGTPRLELGNMTGTTGEIQRLANMSIRNAWQRLECGPFTPSSDLTGRPTLTIAGTGTWNSGDEIWATGFQIEQAGYATSLVSGTRAASSASISPTGILDPASGALAFRITPTIETGVEEIWGECGVKGSGTDHVRWGRDASKHPFVEWSANNASYQRLTGSETLNALTAYDLYLGHSATTISLAVDAGTLQTGTRDAVSASWGAGNLTLEATKGGVVYNQFATFNRTLSTSEIKTLDRRISWSRSMFGNPFAYFQLRPY